MEFKSSLFVVIRSFIYVAIAGVVIVPLIVYWVSNNEAYAIAAGAAILVIAILMLISELRFKVVVEDGKLKEYKGSKLKQEFEINQCSFNSTVKTGGNNIGSDCKLAIRNEVTGEESYIDCTPLGGRRFQKLLSSIGFDDKKPEPVKTEKRGK